ncbi:MAG: restriction endonuclease subunit S [Pseudomonadales bacterium]|nr:restriction endonuclease subunit S [Pseudomonadales bacterium]
MTSIIEKPELRFHEFSCDWAERKGHELFDNSRVKGEDGLPIYSVTLNNGLVPRNSLERRMANDAASNDNLRAQPGDLVYNMMRMWQGAVGLADTECMVSPAYVVLSGKQGIDTRFFDFNLQRARPIYDLWAYSHGLTSDRLRLYFKDFGQIKFSVPTEKEEQQKIAVFLSAVDDKLNQLRRKRKLLESWKRGLIQKIFSQELRLTQDDGKAFPDWDVQLLGNYFSLIGGLTYNPDNVKPDGLLVLRSSNVQEMKITLEDNVYVDLEVNPDSLSRKGDILLCVRNGSKRLIGKSALVPENFPKATHGAFMSLLRGDNNDFIFQVLQSEMFYREIHKNLGATINSINGRELKNFKFFLPTAPLEQQKIAAFLSSVDKKIEAITHKITQTESFKKGLLQKMFV